MFFYEVASGPYFFPPGSRMGPQGTTEGTKRRTHDRYENPSDFLLNSMRSYQDITFPTRIQDGTPRGNQRDDNWKCLTGKKTLSSFYWNSWGPFRTSLFPQGSSMEVLDDLGGQICSSEAGASFFKCFESHTSITRKKKNPKIKQKSINEKPHKKSRENDNFEGVGGNI